MTCTRSDSLSGGQSYPSISLTVSVNTNASFVLNTASVTGGGDATIHNGNDFTNINPAGGGGSPSLTISKSHTGTFVLGQSGSYTITIGNAGTGATTGQVNMDDFLPSAVAATSINAPGWNCSQLPTQFVNCSRSDSLAAGASYPTISITVSINVSGVISNTAQAFGGGDNQFHSATDTVTVNGPTLNISETHNPDPFTVGQTGTYTINVGNTGNTATFGEVTVTDFIPTGLSVANATGTGWSCSGTTNLECTRSDALDPNSSYPTLTLTVNVNAGFSTVTNTVNLSGGGDPAGHSATDTANVVVPVLAITKSHTGSFTVGQTGTYTITVSNNGTVATVGTVTVSDNLPSGMTVNSTSGTGWAFSGMTLVSCTRSDSLAANSSYPAISLTVNVNGGQAGTVNIANLTGGGDLNSHSASDPTTINAPVLAITKTHGADFIVGQPGNYTITVSNSGNVATVGTVTVTDFLQFTLTATAFSGTGMGVLHITHHIPYLHALGFPCGGQQLSSPCSDRSCIVRRLADQHRQRDGWRRYLHSQRLRSDKYCLLHSCRDQNSHWHLHHGTERNLHDHSQQSWNSGQLWQC